VDLVYFFFGAAVAFLVDFAAAFTFLDFGFAFINTP